MRKIILGLVTGVACSLSAQEHFSCGTTDMQNQWFAKHPEYKAEFDKLQQQAADMDAKMAKNGYKDIFNHTSNGSPNGRTTTTSVSNYTIPIVFHILHIGGGENITDAQVQDAVSILTRDYNKRNADTTDVVASFTNNIGNPKFEFQLATKDPNGNCTNGIIRHWDTNTDWSNDFNDYIYTWDRTRYLNVYVVKTMGGGAAGYTYLPGTTGIPATADAVVILSSYVGSIGSGSPFTSRALTHEVGHWFNLQHPWGSTNNPGVACGDDGVTDTPITKGFTTCNLNNSKICNPPIVENMQNYMDYAYCQRMYTQGQTARMLNAINSSIASRNNLSTATNLAGTGVTNPGSGCVPGLQIAVAPTYTICTGQPLSLVSYTYNANPTSYAWTGSTGAVITNGSNANASVTFTSAGTKTVSCLISNANGSASQSAIVYVIDVTPQVLLNYQEGFENNAFPPTNWSVISPNYPLQQWVITGDGFSEGEFSAMIPGESFHANAISMLQSPSYDFKHNPGALYNFKYAYARLSSTNKDLFKLQASKNCGGTWTDIYAPSTANLALNSGGTDNNLFYPLPQEWKFTEITNLSAFTSFKTEQNVTFRFYFQEDVAGTGSGNRFYLDEINFATPTGINELTKQIDFNVYPNPASAAFELSMNLADAAKIKYQVTSITGAVLISVPETQVSVGLHQFKINQNGQLSPGIYFVNLELNGVKMSKKIVID